MTVIPIHVVPALPAASGGKARGLAAIAAAGLPCPPAWSILPEASATDLEALAAELRRRGISLLAVRSSASGEDGPGASFAGVHRTELAVPVERLAREVRAVSRSSLAPRAQAYREQLGLPPALQPCAVVVQAMLDAACAGIAFSRGPGEVIVEAVEGLGEPGVDGTAAPEAWSVRRTPSGWVAILRSARRQREVLRLTAAGLSREAVAPGVASLLPPDVERPVNSTDPLVQVSSFRLVERTRQQSRRLSRRLITLMFAGRNRMVVIRRELPRTSGAGRASRLAA